MSFVLQAPLLSNYAVYIKFTHLWLSFLLPSVQELFATESSVEELITQQVLDLYQADGTWTKLMEKLKTEAFCLDHPGTEDN